MPVIYSQNETGGSRTFGGEMHNRQDYSNLNLDATEIQKKLADPNNMELLKSIMTKLG